MLNASTSWSNISEQRGTALGVGQVPAATGNGKFAASRAISPGWWELKGIYGPHRQPNTLLPP